MFRRQVETCRQENKKNRASKALLCCTEQSFGASFLLGSNEVLLQTLMVAALVRGHCFGWSFGNPQWAAPLGKSSF